MAPCGPHLCSDPFQNLASCTEWTQESWDEKHWCWRSLPRFLHEKSGSHCLSSKPQSLWLPFPLGFLSVQSHSADASTLGVQPGAGRSALTRMPCRGGTSQVQKRWGWIAPVWAPDPVFQGSGKQCGLLVWDPVAPIRWMPRSKRAEIQMCLSTAHSQDQSFLPVASGDCLCLLLKSVSWRTTSGKSSFHPVACGGEPVPSPESLQQEVISSLNPMRMLRAGAESEWVDCEVSQEGKEGAVEACWVVGTENTDSPNNSLGLMGNRVTPVSTSWVRSSCVPLLETFVVVLSPSPVQLFAPPGL